MTDSARGWLDFYQGPLKPPYWPDETLARWLTVLKGPPRRVLELGCGAGRNLVAIRRHGSRPFGADISPDALRKATLRLGYRVPGRLVCASLDALPWADGAFDAVVEVNVLEHLPPAQRWRAVAEAARVLVPGGNAFFRMMASACYGWPLKDEPFEVMADGVSIHTFVFPEIGALLGAAGLMMRGMDLETKCFMGWAPARRHWLVWAVKPG